MVSISAEELAILAGIVLSLIVAYFPPVKRWFEPKPADEKQIWMGLLIIFSGAGVFGLSCLELFGLAIPCTRQGAEGLIMAIIWALLGNVGIYQATKHIGEPKVKEVPNLAEAKRLT